MLNFLSRPMTYGCFPLLDIITYSKTCLKRPLENRQNKGLRDKW